MGTGSAGAPHHPVLPGTPGGGRGCTSISRGDQVQRGKVTRSPHSPVGLGWQRWEGKGQADDKAYFWLIHALLHSYNVSWKPALHLWSCVGGLGCTLSEGLPGVGEAVNETSREDARRR